MFRFIEVATKRILFHLAKSIPQHKTFFTVSYLKFVANFLDFSNFIGCSFFY